MVLGWDHSQRPRWRDEQSELDPLESSLSSTASSRSRPAPIRVVLVIDEMPSKKAYLLN